MIRRLFVAVIALAAVLLLAGCGGKSNAASPSGCAGGLNDHTDATYCGLGLTPPQPRPQFTLTDTNGASFAFGKQTAGKPTLLFFGYTTCPDVCPTTMADLAQALRTVPVAVRDATQVVFVSTDPATDTLPVITSWLRKFDPDLPNKFIGLRGTDADVKVAEAASHITLHEDGGLTHSAEVVLYGADDYAPVAFLQSNDEAADVAHDLQKVVDVK